MVQDKLYSVSEAVQYLGISRSGLYAAIAKGDIISKNVGHRKLIPGWVIAEMIQKPISN